MALHNVTVSCTSFFQNLAPYAGSIRFRLNRPVVVDEELIVPQWQAVTFDSSTGTADVELVPNALLGADTCYQFEVYQTASTTVTRNALVERGSMYVPDEDCNLLDIAVIKSGKETAGMAEGYASECKQIYADTSALVTGFSDQVETASERITTEKNAAITAIDSERDSAIADVASEATSSTATAKTEISAAGNAAIASVNEAATDSVSYIQSEGAAQIAAIDAEASNQISAIKKEGAAQIQAAKDSVVPYAKAKVDEYVEGTSEPSIDAYVESKEAEAESQIGAKQTSAINAVKNQQAQSLAAIQSAESKALTSVEQAGATQTANAKAQADAAAASATSASTEKAEAQKARDASAASAAAAAASATSAAESAAKVATAIETHNSDETAHGLNTIKGDISALSDDVSDLQTGASEAEIERDILKRRVRNLELASQGITHTVEEDSDTEYCKTVPSGAMPNCILNYIGGRSLVWNQIFNGSRSSTGLGVTIKCSKGTFTLSGTSTASGNSVEFSWTDFTANKGHKFICKIDIELPSGDYIFDQYNVNALTDITKNVFTQTENYIIPQLHISQTGVDYDLTGHMMLFDLTQLFGEAYCSARTNDQLKSDIEQLISEKDYWEYNEGEVISGDVTDVVSVGKNLIDMSNVSFSSNQVSLTSDEDGLISLTVTPKGTWAQLSNVMTLALKAGSYTFGVSGDIPFRLYFSYIFKDGTTQNTGIVSSTSTHTYFTLSSDVVSVFLYCSGMTAGNTYSTNFKIELLEGDYSSDESFYPYQSSTLTIPSAITSLPGYGWSAGPAKNWVDYNNRKYVQEVGRVDLGTLDWSNRFDIAEGLFSSKNITYKYYKDTNALSDKYIYKGIVSSATEATTSGSCYLYYMNNINTYTVYVNDTSYSDVSVFKTAMSGVYLYYELAEPIETDLSDILPETTMLTVEEGGTLTFKSSSDLHIAVPSTESYMVKTSTD